MSGDENLLELFSNRRKKLRYKSRIGDAGVARLNLCLVEAAGIFANMWECTRNLPAWDERGALEFGVLTTRAGRCRPIPASYKATMTDELRNGGDTAPQRVEGFVHGLHRLSTPIRLRFMRQKAEKMREQSETAGSKRVRRKAR